MNNLFLSVLEVSLNLSIIIALLLLFSTAIEKHYTSKWNYIIWMILAIKLIIPFNLNPLEPKIQFPLALTYFNEESKNTKEITSFYSTDKVPETNTYNSTINSKTNYYKTSNYTITEKLSFLWIGGIFLFITFFSSQYLLFRKKALRWSIPIKDESILSTKDSLICNLNIKGNLNILKCKIINTPMVIGLFKPILLLPDKNYSPESLYIILNHELIHFKRKDTLYKLLMFLTNAIHWFNPIIYIMVNKANKNLELFCDDEVIKDKDVNFKKQYSNILLSTMYDNVKDNVLLTTHFSGGVNSMKKRFSNIFNNRDKRKGIISLFSVILITLICSNLIGCNDSSSKDSPNNLAKKYIYSCYEIKNYDTANEIMKFTEEAMNNSNNKDSNLATLQLNSSDDSALVELMMKDMGPYISEKNKVTLVTNRDTPANFELIAMTKNFTSEIKNVDLSEIASNGDSKSFEHVTTLKLTYEDGHEEDVEVKGNINLMKSDGKWLINFYKTIGEPKF